LRQPALPETGVSLVELRNPISASAKSAWIEIATFELGPRIATAREPDILLPIARDF